ncbi:protein kinase [Nostocaceae cyanobacterium CENA369]|uniref:non-specific serine/threonine protein kinase n=1 Tax=Dendronalium phyllosphericum CENA369 TaxID=1725256 RepID=A0A8J7I6R9_9NOST|nr:serine/threonine-protein kinase [Dendronalium phyllosphericum]MBH8575223.1 protein kinase [Dendronalium phyllosphericum CENA369]
MQPPIIVGTVLQNRYRVIQILGQGGFGRTYLAEDQRRFNELCAIKELIPLATRASDWEKAQELFQREATILYQIEHPQVPKFRERFDQDQRLFLVEDYVAGKTYRTLLADRLAVGQTFSEAEVLQLIRFLLPVLEHIHSRGIIHRDISPENIILRDSDAKPVLIDFGVVKELATRLQSPDSESPVTTVGKLGYAPSEQMQTGRAYPNSDLYALAVTAIVLLTGREPSDLFDENQLTWNWQRWVRVNPQFAQVLNRMLNRIPSDRYQSAADVAQVLQYPELPGVPAPELSNLQTVAVGRRPDPISPPTTPNNKPDPVITPSRSSSVLDNPLAVGAIGSAVVVLAGFGSWALVSSIRNHSRTSQDQTSPQTFPSPVVSGGTTFASPPTPTPTNEQPVISTKRLPLRGSDTTIVEDTLKANQIIQYSFFGQKGAKLTTFLDQGSGILLSVLNSNQQPIDNTAQQVTSYQGILPITGRYTIQLTLTPGVAQSNYNLNATLEKPLEPATTPTPIETPIQIPVETPTPAPIITPTPIPTPTPTPIITPTPTPNAGGENSPPVNSTFTPFPNPSTSP